MRFKKADDAVLMYKTYAQKAGFDIRKNTQRKEKGNVIQKYVLCHRHGYASNKSVDTKRKSTHKVTNCKARVIIKIEKLTSLYTFDTFDEMHNHSLEELCDLKSARKLSYADKQFIIRASIVKIGATKAFKLKAALNGGFDYINSKVCDFKNFTRDIENAITFKDAQLVINKLNDRKSSYPNYIFAYRCGENNVLNAMFWADETDKAYY